MITEFSGTAFPTKLRDSADKRTTHARAYARVYSHSNLSKDLLGIIGWCAFDYNTHADYGSGDKICYHVFQNTLPMCCAARKTRNRRS